MGVKWEDMEMINKCNVAKESETRVYFGISLDCHDKHLLYVNHWCDYCTNAKSHQTQSWYEP